MVPQHLQTPKHRSSRRAGDCADGWPANAPSSNALNAKHYLDQTPIPTKEERDGSEGPTPSETSTSSRHVESAAGDLGTANYETQQPQGRELSCDLNEDQEPHPAQSLPQAIKAEHLKPLVPLRRYRLI
jgi:hypothetical protein